MRNILGGTLITAMPLLVAIGLLAAPKPKAAVPIQIPITGQAQDAAGNRYILSGSVTLTIDTPLPTPTPDPLSISYVTVAPAVVAPGSSAVVTVVLTRAAGAAIPIALKSADPDGQIAAQMTIAAGQDHGTAAVTTAATITVEKYLAFVATLNGQSRSANLTVRPGTPLPTPTPTPMPLPTGPSPRVEALTAPDGTPLVLPASPGQRIRVVGQGMGTEVGELWWNGIPMSVEGWKDTEAVGRLPRPSGATGGVELRTKAGGFWGGMLVPDEPWPDPSPPQNPPGLSSARLTPLPAGPLPTTPSDPSRTPEATRSPSARAGLPFLFLARRPRSGCCSRRSRGRFHSMLPPSCR